MDSVTILHVIVKSEIHCAIATGSQITLIGASLRKRQGSWRTSRPTLARSRNNTRRRNFLSMKRAIALLYPVTMAIYIFTHFSVSSSKQSMLHIHVCGIWFLLVQETSIPSDFNHAVFVKIRRFFLQNILLL